MSIKRLMLFKVIVTIMLAIKNHLRRGKIERRQPGLYK
jgi:hypothetical protein